MELTKVQRERLAEISDGRLYPRRDKQGTTGSLIAIGLVEMLEHSITGHQFVRITDKGLFAVGHIAEARRQASPSGLDGGRDG